VSANALHAFASAWLARESAKFPLVLVLEEIPGVPSAPEGIAPVREEGDALVFASGATLPLRPGLSDPRPLDEEEIRRLSPATLRVRLLGVESEDEPESAQVSEAEVSERPKASVAALQAAVVDLEELARKRPKGLAPANAKQQADYEAGDFELK